MATSPKDLLATYRKKRDFASTPEPSGDDQTDPGRRYIVQKHEASSLHYDFRLELDGVLKSWAVTKGPSLTPSEKRLAVQTEDHPVAYADFEGVIPDGYGAGTVMLWDTGTWEPQTDDPAADLADGQLKIILHGERLTGGWALVLMKDRSTKARKNWLLIKERDDAADDDDEGRVLEEYTDSVVSGRSMEEIAAEERGGELPPFIEPQLATLADRPPDGEDWFHEIKYDGYRIQARKAGDAVCLVTRNGKNWTHKYPAIADAIRALPADRLSLDGELVAVDEDGRSAFGLLQNAGEDPQTRLVYYVFDLLHLGMEDWTDRPLRERKDRLSAFLADGGPPLVFSDHVEGEGDSVIARACDMALEGVISKQADGAYRSGRNRDWIKSKCVGQDEFVVGGYRRSDKKGRPFSSLLVGEFEGDRLRYRGRVGTGYTEDDLDQLHTLLSPMERKTPPFDEVPREARDRAIWVTPKLVVQVGYTERTAGGILRHPSFLGVREDKEAEDVQMPGDGSATDSGSRKAVPDAPGGSGGPATVAGVRITHPDRVVFDAQNITKGDLAAYLATMADHLLPHTKDRPISLVRCPSGRTDKCFFQKHHGASVPEEIGCALIAEKDGEEKTYLLLDDTSALVASAQIGALELHGWGARTDRLERPDRLVIDLDPDEGMDFGDVKVAAEEVRDVLRSAGLETFALLTGGKGIHVVAPLERRRGWNDVKAAARGLARKLAEAAPDRYVAEASKAKRKGKIFLDWLRNERGATAIVPYSARARDGAPVATPIRWDELSGIDAAAQYTVRTIGRRLSSLKADPWEGYADMRQSVTDALLDAVGE